MKISQYKNEEALELLADIIDPVSVIFNDKQIQKEANGGDNLKLIKLVLKKYSKEVVKVLARLDGVDPKDYDANIAKMMNDLMEIVTDEEMMSFFTSAKPTK